MQRTVTNLFETELACAWATTDTSTLLKQLLREITEGEGHTKSPVTCPWQGRKTGVGIQVLERAASVRRAQPPPAAPGKNYSVLFTSSSQALTYTAETLLSLVFCRLKVRALWPFLHRGDAPSPSPGCWSFTELSPV